MYHTVTHITITTRSLLKMTNRSSSSRKTLQETEVAPEVDTDIQCAETSGAERADIRSVQRAI